MTSLTGKVTLDGGAPAKGAVVELHNSTGDVVDQVQVDDQGSYRYNLSPGKWRLNLWDASGHRGSEEVTLDKDEDKTLNVVLTKQEG